jgi:pre-mRNA-processing factor 8
MPPAASSDPSSSRLPPEVLSVKSQKWIQMQKKRYGQKRRGGFVDMGKQVRHNANSRYFQVLSGGAFA